MTVKIEPNLKPWERNVLAVYRRATIQQKSEGAMWYPLANKLAETLSPDNIERGCGVIAALSPQLSWVKNKELAIQLFENGGLDRGCLPASIKKANAIYNNAHPLTVLGGKKVLSFYANILNPEGNDVTIDRHSFDIAVGRVTDDKSRGILGRKGVYEEFARITARAAKREGVAPAAMQSVTWEVWRAEKGLS